MSEYFEWIWRKLGFGIAYLIICSATLLAQLSGNLERSEDGVVSFSWLSSAFYGYDLQTSPDLENWEVFGDFYGTGRNISVPLIQIIPNDPSTSPSVNPQYFERRRAHFTLRVFDDVNKLLVSWRPQDAEGLTHALLDLDFGSVVGLPFFFGRYTDLVENVDYNLSFYIINQTFDPMFDAFPISALTAEEVAHLAWFTDRTADVLADMQGSLAGITNVSNTTESAVGEGNFFRVLKRRLDSDADGLFDDEEDMLNMDPWLQDSDGDGFSDWEETLWGTDPRDPLSNPASQPEPTDLFYTYFSASLPEAENSGDEDADGLLDEFEQEIGSSISSKDSDGDGLIDSRDMWPVDSLLSHEVQPLPQYFTVELPALGPDIVPIDVNAKGQVLLASPGFSENFPSVWDAETGMNTVLTGEQLTQPVNISDGFTSNGQPKSKVVIVTAEEYQPIGITDSGDVVANCLFKWRPPASTNSSVALSDVIVPAIVVWNSSGVVEILDTGIELNSPVDVITHPSAWQLNGDGKLIGATGDVTEMPTLWLSSQRSSPGVPLYSSSNSPSRTPSVISITHSGEILGAIDTDSQTIPAIWSEWSEGINPKHELPEILSGESLNGFEKVGDKYFAHTANVYYQGASSGEAVTWLGSSTVIPSFSGSLDLNGFVANGAVYSNNNRTFFHHGAEISFSVAFAEKGKHVNHITDVSSSGIFLVTGQKDGEDWAAISIPVSIKLVEQHAGSALGEEVGIPLSISSPQIYVTSSNVTPSENVSGELVADIVLSGTVDSPAADLTFGTDACPKEILVHINGGIGEDGVPNDKIPISITELANTADVYRYPKDLNFQKTLHGIPVTEGLNVINLSTGDKVFALSGFQTLAFTVTVTTDVDGNVTGVSSDVPVQVDASDGGVLRPLAIKLEFGSAGSSAPIKLYGDVKFQFGVGDGDGTGQVHDAYYDVANDQWFIKDPNSSSPLPLTFVYKPSFGDEIGASDEGGGGIAAANGLNGGVVINKEGALNRQRLRARFGSGGLLENISDAGEFLDGFESGLVEGGAELVTGTVDVVKGAGFYVNNGLMLLGCQIRLGFNTLTNDQTEADAFRMKIKYTQGLKDEVHDDVIIVAKAAQAFAQKVSETRHAINLAIIGRIIGDTELAEAADTKVSADFHSVATAMSEIFYIIQDQLSGEPPYEQGRLFGRLTFEPATIVIPMTKSGQIGKIGALLKQRGLAVAGEMSKGGLLFKKITQRAALFLTRFARTKMCFVAGTLVHARIDGVEQQIGIEQLEPKAKAGHQVEVWSQDEFTKVYGWKPVINYFTTHPEELVHVGIDLNNDAHADEKLSGTAPHPFWVVEADKFVPIGDLEEGQTLYVRGGEFGKVVSTQRERAPPGGSFTTYNFEVEDFHTYFVGQSGVWVHNTGAAACRRMFSLFDRILDFKNYKGNLGKGYDDIVRRLGNSLDQDLKSTFVEGILEDLPRLKDAGKVDPRIVAFATEDGVFKPAEAFLGSRFELLSGRRITGRAPTRFDPVTGNQLPGADFVDELGNIWDGVGPLPKSAWATQSRLDGFYTQITRHIDVPEKGNPIIDLAGLPDSLKQRAVTLVKARLSDPNTMDFGVELLLDNGKKIILLGD
jgi:hypothetical protein